MIPDRTLGRRAFRSGGVRVGFQKDDLRLPFPVWHGTPFKVIDARNYPCNGGPNACQPRMSSKRNSNTVLPIGP